MLLPHQDLSAALVGLAPARVLDAPLPLPYLPSLLLDQRGSSSHQSSSSVSQSFMICMPAPVAGHDDAMILP